MGGEHDRLTAAEAASVIGWWIEAGVDVAIQEQPRAWLGEAASHSPVFGGQAEPASATTSEDLPNNLEAFRGWFAASPSLPLAQPNSRRVLPKGAEAAEIMLLGDMPTAEDAAQDQPIGGQALELMERMLADGWIETRPGDDDPEAIELMHKLAKKSRKRWPETAIAAPRLGV